MAAADNPSAIDLAIEAWRNAFAVLSRMPTILGAAILLGFLLELVPLPGAKDDTSFGRQVLGFGFSILDGLFLTPVAIATHRFVLLGEVTPQYKIALSEPRFIRFFAFTVVYQLLGVPAMLMLLKAKADPTGSVLVFVSFGLVFVTTAVVLRMLILFPAIAVDARGAAWRNAAADTKGHTWRVFRVVVLTWLPMLIVVPFNLLLDKPETGFAGTLALSALSVVLGVLELCAFAAVASKLFVAFANRLNG